MLLIGIGWLYVVGMVAVVQATAPDGHWLGALATLLFWGGLPVGIGGYLLLAPARRRRRRAAEAVEAADMASIDSTGPSAGLDPDQRRHPAGDPVAPVRKET